MKKLLMLIMAVGLLTACGETSTEPEEPKVQPKKEVVKEEVVKPTVEISEPEASFLNFTFEIKKAKLKDGHIILETLYTNDSFPGEKAFMAAAGIDVHQNGELLEEVSGVTQDPKSNYFYKNEVGIWAPIDFKYKLLNETDDIVLTIVPRDGEEPKTITVTLQ